METLFLIIAFIIGTVIDSKKQVIVYAVADQRQDYLSIIL